MSDETSFLNVGVLFAIGLLLLYILVAHCIEENKVDFLHESGVSVLMGALAGLMAFLIAEETIAFSESGFFYFVLPPIIFAAGYTLKRRNFIKNISYILLLGLVGTIISMV